jgi:hypothetical protein
LEQDYIGTIDAAKNAFVTWVGTINIFVVRRILDNILQNNMLAFMKKQDHGFVDEVVRLLRLAQTQVMAATLKVLQFWPIAKKAENFRWRWKMLSHLERFQVEQDAKMTMTDFAVINQTMPERELQNRMQGLAQTSLLVVVQDRWSSEIARAERVVMDLRKQQSQSEKWLNDFTERLRNVEKLVVRKEEDVSNLLAQLQFAADAQKEWTVDEEGAEAERDHERQRVESDY